MNLEEGQLITCPNCLCAAQFEELPEGYASKRWPDAVDEGTRKEEPYVKCSVCTATFPKWGIEEYLTSQ